MGRAIGIDLGTTNSLVAHVDARNRPQVIAADEGRPLLPSAVHYASDGTIEVGAAARRRAPERPVDTILSVKRFMGAAPATSAPRTGASPASTSRGRWCGWWWRAAPGW